MTEAEVIALIPGWRADGTDEPILGTAQLGQPKQLIGHYDRARAIFWSGSHKRDFHYRVDNLISSTKDGWDAVPAACEWVLFQDCDAREVYFVSAAEWRETLMTYPIAGRGLRVGAPMCIFKRVNMDTGDVRECE